MSENLKEKYVDEEEVCDMFKATMNQYDNLSELLKNIGKGYSVALKTIAELKQKVASLESGAELKKLSEKVQEQEKNLMNIRQVLIRKQKRIEELELENATLLRKAEKNKSEKVQPNAVSKMGEKKRELSNGVYKKSPEKVKGEFAEHESKRMKLEQSNPSNEENDTLKTLIELMETDLNRSSDPKETKSSQGKENKFFDLAPEKTTPVIVPKRKVCQKCHKYYSADRGKGCPRCFL